MGSVVWLDPDYRLTSSNISLWLDSAKEEGVVVWQQGEATATTGRRLARSSSLNSNRRFGDSAFRTSTALGAK